MAVTDRGLSQPRNNPSSNSVRFGRLYYSVKSFNTRTMRDRIQKSEWKENPGYFAVKLMCLYVLETGIFQYIPQYIHKDYINEIYFFFLYILTKIDSTML